MKKVNLIMAGLSSLGLLACGESESLVGKWTQRRKSFIRQYGYLVL